MVISGLSTVGSDLPHNHPPLLLLSLIFSQSHSRRSFSFISFVSGDPWTALIIRTHCSKEQQGGEGRRQ
jgi:hypothetical protein